MTQDDTSDDTSEPGAEEGPPPTGETGQAPPGETGEAPGETDEPAQDMHVSYRVDCLDIQSLGDADDRVFQVATLQNTWSEDIANFRLNILVDVLRTDEVAGSGAITIRSGIGRGAADQCAEGETASAELPVAYQPYVTRWAPAAETCATAADGGGSGTLELELGAHSRVYIYAEDDEGTALNCSLVEAAPHAIPIRGLSATITSTADHGALAGTLTGCMAEADTHKTCSCMSACTGNPHPDCPGCPAGALPLGQMLGAIATTPHCTELLGEPAFDVVLQFSAGRLSDAPETCG